MREIKGSGKPQIKKGHRQNDAPNFQAGRYLQTKRKTNSVINKIGRRGKARSTNLGHNVCAVPETANHGQNDPTAPLESAKMGKRASSM